MGYGVTRFNEGDIVYGMPRFPRAAGAYAEYVTAPSRQFACMPDGISPAEAAALPLAALTAWQCLADVAHVSGGQTVLVHGAGGGVGHLAVQIVRALGARVLATGRDDRDAMGSRAADVALDLVGGADTLELIDSVRDGGLLLAVADGAGDEVKSEGKRRGVRVQEPLVEPDCHALDEIAKLVGSGALKVIVAETFPLERADAAHKRLERGGVRGKLVLEVGRD
jgi:NADPH:quinone reductase-like Zn-dependent oxidoreductase